MPITLTKRTLAIGLLTLALAVSPTLTFAQASRQPLITSVNPPAGGPGQVVHIQGQGFTNMNVISLEGPERGYPLGESPDKIHVIFTVPSLPPGTYALKLNNMHGVTSNVTTFGITTDAPRPLPPLPSPTPHPTALPLPPPGPHPTFIPTPFPTIIPHPTLGPTIPPLPPTPQDCPWWKWWCRPPVLQQYVALGDSIGMGLISTKGYVSHYRDFLQSVTGVQTNVTNLSQIGWSSSQLLQALRTNNTMRQAIRDAHFVTWNIGGKDLLDARELYQNQACGGGDNQQCLRETSSQLRANWSGIVNEVVRLRGGSVAGVQTMDIYNPFVSVDLRRDSWPNDAGTDWHVLQTHLTGINIHLFVTAQQNGIRVAPVFTEFNGREGTEDPRQKGYISFDGFHPNDLGHEVIARLLADRNR